MFSPSISRPTKPDKNSEELLAADRQVEKFKDVLEKISKKFVQNSSNSSSSSNACIDQDPVALEKRCKKVHEYKLAQAMEESVRELPECLLRDVLDNCGECFAASNYFPSIIWLFCFSCILFDSQIGKDHRHGDGEQRDQCGEWGDEEIVADIGQSCDDDTKAKASGHQTHAGQRIRKAQISGERGKASATARTQTDNDIKRWILYLQAALRVNENATKINQLREEQEECESKLEKERDIWAAEMFELIAEERNMASYIVNYIQFQKLYYKSALDEIDGVMQRVQELISEWHLLWYASSVCMCSAVCAVRVQEWQIG